MVKVIVKIKYVEEGSKEETIMCCDVPIISERWLTLYPYKNPTSRKFIRIDIVEKIEYSFE